MYILIKYYRNIKYIVSHIVLPYRKSIIFLYFFIDFSYITIVFPIFYIFRFGYDFGQKDAKK